MAQLASLALFILVGCTYPNQFRNVRAGLPHADLAGDGIKLIHINDQPTSFWRSQERFRVSPGSITVRTISGYRGDVHYPLLRFTAEEGHAYSAQLLHAEGSDRIIVRDVGGRIVSQEERERAP